MKKALAAMVVMAIVIVPLCGLWSLLLQPLIGGGVEQSFLYLQVGSHCRKHQKKNVT